MAAKQTPGVSVTDSRITQVQVKSRRFLCATCMEWLIEWTPVIKKGYGQQFLEQMRRERNRAILEGKRPSLGLSQVRLECPRGCSDSKFWTFRDITNTRGGTFRPMQ